MRRTRPLKTPIFAGATRPQKWALEHISN